MVEEFVKTGATWKKFISLPGESWIHLHDYKPVFPNKSSTKDIWLSNYGRSRKGDVIMLTLPTYELIFEVFKKITFIIDYSNEVWKDIPNYEKLYQVSSKGRVRKYKDNEDSENDLLRVEKDYLYNKVLLIKDSIGVSYYLRELVARAFIDNPSNFPCVAYNNVFNCNYDGVENIHWSPTFTRFLYLSSNNPGLVYFNTYDLVYEFDFYWEKMNYMGRCKFVYEGDALELFKFLGQEFTIRARNPNRNKSDFHK